MMLGRFDITNGVSRVIIFLRHGRKTLSMQVLILLRTRNAISKATSAAKRFPMDLNNADIYVYGIGYSHRDSSLDLILESYWDNLFIESGAHLVSFQQQLSLPKSSNLVFEVKSFTGVMVQEGGAKIATDLRLGFTDNGKLVNSWFGSLDDRYPLEGSYKCVSTKCKINAKIIGGGDPETHMFREKDVLNLEGSLTNLRGTIGSVDETTRVASGKKFELDIVFESDSTLRF